jgi:hypothetical protein
MEHCLVSTSIGCSEISSTIIGCYEGKICKLDYRLKTNGQWETLLFEMQSRYDNHTHSISLEGDGKGSWTQDGKRCSQFQGCVDIDISLTPLTNTLPINRLNLALNQSEVVQVIYVDVLHQKITPELQRYTRLSGTLYHYQNIPNDFESDILVDELGLVVDYPGLFLRTCALKIAYPNNNTPPEL